MHPVLIVGAGPVGLTLAWRLACAQLPVMVLEAEPAISDQLRASTFHPPTLDMFDAAGITAELVAAGRITPQWQIRHHETGDRVVFDLAAIAGDTGHPYRLQCRQAVLSRALLARLPAGTVRFSAHVDEVGQDHEGVSARIGEDTVRGSWLVGCDGARSVVRKAMGVSLEGQTYPEHTILATTHLPFEDHLPGLCGVNYIWEPRGTYSLLRLPDVWRISLHPRAGETPQAALEDSALRARTAELLPDAPPVEIVEKRIYRVHRRIVDRYVAGRMVLAGDAAHLNSPKGGMGMNGGIHDAMNLADKLVAVANGARAEPLLAAYERQRRPIAADEILARADANRARMNTTDPARRAAHLAELKAIAAHPDRARTFLLGSSMIAGLRRAAALAA
ncbi:MULTISPECIES: FAD-dependent monooxygenase [unclassified Roseitalea]|uniref:FAD-dependent oxidoreductase n=1 Tax=unclassified Roseitalea TaxID=2639107 RepID=UPI00273EE093|nr:MULTISPECIES: FAD-dependent monooxygenase [unclassified Roseitalea]